MKFLKEYIIIIVILIIVITINYFSQNKLSNSVYAMQDSITSVENKLIENNEDEAEEEFFKAKNKWLEESEKLEIFVEHKELEEIEGKIQVIESNFNRDELDELYENIANLKFMLNRIDEKNQLKLKNIL